MAVNTALNHRSTTSKRARAPMYVEIPSRSPHAWGENSTRKAMFLPKLFFRLIYRNAKTSVQLFHAPPDCGEGLGSLQAIEKKLIALGILDHQFGASVDSQYKR